MNNQLFLLLLVLSTVVTMIQPTPLLQLLGGSILPPKQDQPHHGNSSFPLQEQDQFHHGNSSFPLQEQDQYHHGNSSFPLQEQDQLHHGNSSFPPQQGSQKPQRKGGRQN